jgi:hypothetical protein
MYSTLSPPLNVVHLSKIRQNLRSYRRQVEAGQVIPVNYYSELIGYLIPVGVAEKLVINSQQDMPLKDFRNDLQAAWESVDRGIDCIWLTYRDERRMAFVSTRIYQSEVSDTE